MPHATIKQLDKYIVFLTNESQKLKAFKQGWADAKAVTMDEIRELIRQLRQDRQMAGMDGKPIGSSG